MYYHGDIVISTENGLKPVIPYRDNIEDILILENEIEFLEKCLQADSEKLETKIADRAFRTKDSKHISIFGSMVAVAAAFGLGHVAGLSHEEMTNTIMGPMSEYLAYSIPMSAGCIGFVQMISLLGLTYRPSKKEIDGLEEKIKFEEEMLALFRKELQHLEERPTYDRKELIEDMTSYDVHYEYSLEYLREALKLRYAFGYNTEKFIKLYEEEDLSMILLKEGFSDDVIMEFLGFLKQRIDSMIKTGKITKK